MADTLALGDDVAATAAQVVVTLRAGRLAVLPTDSVYALVADAFKPVATRRIFGAKRRSREQPLPVVIRSPRQVSGLVADVPETAERLMAAYWPGPLTLCLRAADGLTWDLGETHGTVALRLPTDELLLEVVKEIGPLACTAANRKGEPAPVTVDEARQQVGSGAALLVDGGLRDGPVSTVVDCSRGRAEVLREGAVPADDVAQVAEGRLGWGQRPAGRAIDLSVDLSKDDG